MKRKEQRVGRNEYRELRRMFSMRFMVHPEYS
jgi:hypothetical protein